MKLSTRALSLLSIASLVLFLANCGGGGGETDPKKVQFGKLKASTWNIDQVTLGTVDRINDFTGFTITFAGDFDPDAVEGEYPYTFLITGDMPDPSPWPLSGNWALVYVDGNSGAIEREDDEMGISYQIDSNNQLTLTFYCDGCNYPGNRTAQVDGEWEFILD